jgi:malate dehydrogenase (oxaloacetate-decarboxylating)(NADP+)
MERKGVSTDEARTVVRTNNTVIAALMVRRREADAMLTGVTGRFDDHFKAVQDVVGCGPDTDTLAAMNVLLLPRGTFFLCDTQVTPDPTAEQICEVTLMAAEAVRYFGVTPKVALLSHSNFGTANTPSAAKMRRALDFIRLRAPDLEVEGEMHADAAVQESVRLKLFPNSRLTGQANLLVMPTLDAAHISLNLLRALGEGLSVGPILLGAALPAHILQPTASVRGIVNMTALGVVHAQSRTRGGEPAGILAELRAERAVGV